MSFPVSGRRFRPWEGYCRPKAAGISREGGIFFIPERYLIAVTGIKPGTVYRAFFFGLRKEEYDAGAVVPYRQGAWQPPKPLIVQAAALVMETKGFPHELFTSDPTRPERPELCRGFISATRVKKGEEPSCL